MMPIVLQPNAEPFEGLCALCQKAVVLEPGLQLCHAERDCPVCVPCGRRCVPALVALQELAHTADYVARIHTHTLMPPLTALLELARAAERYSSQSCTPVLS